jgi:hypothetical protein
VPYRALPELRRVLTTEYQTHSSHVESGCGRTAVMLLRDRQHFAPRKENQ